MKRHFYIKSKIHFPVIVRNVIAALWNSLISIVLIIVADVTWHNCRRKREIMDSERPAKRHLRADGLSLLPSALRPRLVGCGGSINRSSSKNDGKNKNKNSSNSCRIIGYPHFRTSVLATMALCSLAFSLFIQNSYVSNVSAASLTITIPSNPLSLDLNPSSNNGFSSISSSFNVKTDNSSGYTVSIKSKNDNGDNSLVNGSSSNNKLTSITEAISEDTFKNGSKYLNMWGWLPSKLNNLDNTNYQIAPGTEEVILESTEEANNEAGINYNISLAAKVDSSAPAGNYSNTFVITSIANQPKIAGIMQEWDYNDCSALGEEEVVTLQDNRDNNTYKVAKLKDGRCWMVENLRIGGDEPIEMTPVDSDVSSNFTLPASNATMWNRSYNTARIYVPTQDSGSSKKEFGGYYNWYAATAGTGTNHLVNGQIASSSICPKGWRLPNGKFSDSDFQLLYNQYDSVESMLNGAPHFLLAGYYFWWQEGQEISGNYWSSTQFGDSSDGDSNAYRLYVDGSRVDPATDSDYQIYGLSVRCIVRQPKKITDLHYLQEWSDLTDDEREQVKDSMQDETNYTLTDRRDSTQYTVAKLKDGKLWMTQNLRIVNKTISNADSDIASGTFTIPASDLTKFNTGNGTWPSHIEDNMAYYDNNVGYGAYYPWYTATAGTGTASLTTDGQNAPGSICPKGWRLPTGSSDPNSDHQQLYENYPTGAELAASPSNFTYAGLIYFDGRLGLQGLYGNYWSSTVGNATGVYSLDIESRSTRISNGNSGRAYGYSARCLARDPNEKSYSITYDVSDSPGGSVQSLPSPNPQTGTTTEDSVQISSDPAVHQCQTFKGWCTKKVPSVWYTNDNLEESCKAGGNYYNPGDMLPLTSTNNEITLYAMWIQTQVDCSIHVTSN